MDPRELPEWLQMEIDEREAEHRATRLTIAAIALTVILGGCGGALVLARWWG